MEGSGAFASLPVAIRNLSPWTGGRELSITITLFRWARIIQLHSADLARQSAEPGVYGEAISLRDVHSGIFIEQSHSSHKDRQFRYVTCPSSSRAAKCTLAGRTGIGPLKRDVRPIRVTTLSFGLRQGPVRK